MSKKKYPPPQRSLECGTCAYREFVEYLDPRYYLETCPQCKSIETQYPELYQWILDVIEKKTISESRVQDIVDSSRHPVDPCY